MFLIARRILKSSGAAFCIMAAFLLFPTVVSQHVNTIHDTQFIIVFLLWLLFLSYGAVRLVRALRGLVLLGQGERAADSDGFWHLCAPATAALEMGGDTVGFGSGGDGRGVPADYAPLRGGNRIGRLAILGPGKNPAKSSKRC